MLYFALYNSGGWLLYFILLTSIANFFNAVIGYCLPLSAGLFHFRGHNAPEPQPLLARVYGTLNLCLAILRVFAATDLSNQPDLYDFVAWSYAVVLFLYSTEIMIYRTIAFRDVRFSLVSSVVGLVWMVFGRQFYMAGGDELGVPFNYGDAQCLPCKERS